jgi:cyclic pyranopterin monophosphate synthase
MLAHNMRRKTAATLKALPHLNDRGQAHMVDVGGKAVTERTATASALVRLSAETADRLAAGTVPKGDVLAVARIAGISAAKRTDELIPLCHRVALTSVEVELRVDRDRAAVEISATARALDRTGVEMEALVAASVAALTIYDMLKGIDRGIEIASVFLVEKAGGRSGTWRRGQAP